MNPYLLHDPRETKHRNEPEEQTADDEENDHSSVFSSGASTGAGSCSAGVGTGLGGNGDGFDGSFWIGGFSVLMGYLTDGIAASCGG